MDSLTNPLIQCKNCLKFYRKANETEHMQTCIDAFYLEHCPHCAILFPETQLESHIQTHHNNTNTTTTNNINTEINALPPTSSSTNEYLDFYDLTEDYNAQLEHELSMKKIYGIDNTKNKKKRGFKNKFKSGMKKAGKHIVNFLYRNKIRFLGAGLTVLSIATVQTELAFCGVCLVIYGGSSTNLFDMNKQGSTSKVNIVDLLPISDVKEESKIPSELKCVICLEMFNVGDKFTALPCLHLFHFECIESCLKRKMECPVCKLEITHECLMDKDFK
jgi:hypothetical protein